MRKSVKVFELSLNPQADINKQWDYGMICDLFDDKMWDVGVDYEREAVIKLPRADVAVVVVPARHHTELIDEVNFHINKINHVVLFLMGDEEADFLVEKIDHPSVHIWVQNPHPGRHDNFNKLGTGYPPHIYRMDTTKTIDVFFSGQITHERRKEMKDVLDYYRSERPGSKMELYYTEGFTQGLTPRIYFEKMSQAKIVPCPSGAVIPDSFRLFESLESMCVPIADDRNSTNTIDDYWDWLFGEEVPFPRLKEYDRLFGLIDEELEKWPNNMHKITAWWINYKRNLAYKVKEQLDV